MILDAMSSEFGRHLIDGYQYYMGWMGKSHTDMYIPRISGYCENSLR